MAIGVYYTVLSLFLVLTALFGAMVFLQRRLVHSILALTAAFTMSALLFAIIGQQFIALLQLLLFVGGFSTYLMVSLANETKGRRYIRLAYFIPLAVILAIMLCYFAFVSVPPAASLGTQPISATFPEALAEYYPIFYLMIALLFSAGIGSALFLKKFVKLVS
ncbi:MAG: hypothetical protein QXF01_00560 [Candidatus Micrarchaeaceae archaeon]